MKQSKSKSENAAYFVIYQFEFELSHKHTAQDI